MSDLAKIIIKLTFNQKLIALLSFLVLAIICGFLIPRKEFDFTDHGYYLYNAYILAHGVIPTAGLGDIINSIFMVLGFRSYLFFEILYTLALSAAIFIFWKSFIKKWALFSLPCLLCIGLTCKITYMMNYQNSPEVFLLASFGVLNFATTENNDIRRRILFSLSSVVLCLSGFSNISLIPALVVNLGLIWIIVNKEPQRYFFYIPYGLLCVLLAILYIKSPLSMLKQHNSAHLTVIDILNKIPLLAKTIFLKNQIITYAIPLIVLYRICEYKYQKLAKINLKPHIFIILTVLLFVAQYFNFIKSASSEFDIINFSVFLFNILLIALVIFINFSKEHIKILIAALITIMYACLLALTTQSEPESHIYLFGAAYIVLTVVLFQSSNKKNIFFNLMLVVLAIFSGYLYLNYSYRASNTFSHKQYIANGTLQGIYADRNKIYAMNQITHFYNTNDCKDKLFIAYPALPLLYYVFEHRALNDSQWLEDDVSQTKAEDILPIMQAQQHWCLVVANGFNYADKSYLQAVTDYAYHHSQAIGKYTSLNKPIDHSDFPDTVMLFSN